MLHWSDVLRRSITVRRVITVGFLTLAWCAMWGSFSAANVMSGVLVASVALTVGARGQNAGGVRIGPLLKLIGLVAIDMVSSTVAVVREVLTPTDYTDEAIIAVPVPPGSEHHLLLLFVAITVTPGTAVVAAEADATVIYLHVLHADKRDEVAAHVQQLADIANEALPQRSVESEREEVAS